MMNKMNTGTKVVTITMEDRIYYAAVHTGRTVASVLSGNSIDADDVVSVQMTEPMPPEFAMMYVRQLMGVQAMPFTEFDDQGPRHKGIIAFSY